MAELTYELGGNWLLKLKGNGGYSSAKMRIIQEDGGAYSIEMSETMGYLAPVIIEGEGKVPYGQITVIYKEVNGRKEVLASYGEGLNGTVMTLKDRMPEAANESRCVQTNPKRILGKVAVAAIKVDENYVKTEDEFWIDISDFIEASEDGCALAALVKTGLVKP